MTNKNFSLISINVAVFNHAKSLQHCLGVLLELLLELMTRLAKTNHPIFALQTGFINNETGQTLQLDGLFFSKLGA